MDKKQIATIMTKFDLGAGHVLYYCDHAAIGKVDEETQYFIDEKTGEKYVPMMTELAIGDDCSKTYHNLVDLEKARNAVGKSIPIPIILTEFENLCKNSLFYMGKDENGKVFCAILNKDEIQKAASTTASDEEKEYRYADDFSIDLELDQLLQEIVDGKYTTEELSEVLNDIEISMGEMEEIIDTIHYQIQQQESYKTETISANENGNKKEKKNTRIDIEDVFKKVTKTLIAQDEPARRVITEIARKEMDARKKKEGILLTGPTGIGKTELMRLIAKYIDRPFYKVDSTKLTMPGYVGTDIEEVLWDLYEKCGKDLKKAESAIIFFDEIDKKGSDRKNDPSGQGVLNVLLPFIEGTEYDACSDGKLPCPKVRMSTKDMTVILGGAYSDVYKSTDKHDLGFLKGKTPESKEKKFSTKDFVEYGMMTNEFMSRVTVIKLNELDVNSIKRIMLESDESAMKIQQEIFEKLGVKLTFTDGYTTAVAENAAAKRTGARGLNGIIDESTWKAFEEVYINPNKYKEVILDENTLENPENYQLIKKRGKRSISSLNK